VCLHVGVPIQGSDLPTEQEHTTLRAQIEELKVALEHAQMLRRRKIEYDLIADKVNTLPPRDELELCVTPSPCCQSPHTQGRNSTIDTLENDIAAIRAEHELQSRSIHNQKSALDSIISDLTALRFIGKDKEPPTASNSTRATPMPDLEPSLEAMTEDAMGGSTSLSLQHRHEGLDEKDDGEEGQVVDSASPGQTDEGLSKEDDIEMGEVEEEPRITKKSRVREELEEGEASDFGSDLTDPPDND